MGKAMLDLKLDLKGAAPETLARVPLRPAKSLKPVGS